MCLFKKLNIVQQTVKILKLKFISLSKTNIKYDITVDSAHFIVSCIINRVY